jgi:Tfp pilus assembly protein PilN
VTQVNLLPPELRQRQATRRTTSLVALVGVAALAAIGFFYFLQTMNLSSAKDELAAQQATNAAIQGEVAKLQKFAELQAELESKKQLVGTALANEVSWSGVLLDVSRVIPGDEALTQLTGQITATGAGAAPTAAGLVGSISFTGTAKEIDTLSSWLTRLETVKGWVNSWASTASETGEFSRIYTFTSGIDLTTDALTRRGRGGQ